MSAAVLIAAVRCKCAAPALGVHQYPPASPAATKTTSERGTQVVAPAQVVMPQQQTREIKSKGG